MFTNADKYSLGDTLFGVSVTYDDGVRSFLTPQKAVRHGLSPRGVAFSLFRVKQVLPSIPMIDDDANHRRKGYHLVDSLGKHYVCQYPFHLGTKHQPLQGDNQFTPVLNTEEIDPSPEGLRVLDYTGRDANLFVEFRSALENIYLYRSIGCVDRIVYERLSGLGEMLEYCFHRQFKNLAITYDDDPMYECPRFEITSKILGLWRKPLWKAPRIIPQPRQLSLFVDTPPTAVLPRATFSPQPV